MTTVLNEKTVALTITPSLLTALAKTTAIKFNPSEMHKDNSGFCGELSKAAFNVIFPNESCFKIEGQDKWMGFFDGLGYYPFNITFDGEYGTAAPESLREAIKTFIDNSYDYLAHSDKASDKIAQAGEMLEEGDVECDYNVDIEQEAIVFSVGSITITTSIKKIFGYNMEIAVITDSNDALFDDFILFCGMHFPIEDKIGDLGEEVGRYCIEDASNAKEINEEVRFRLQSILTASTYQNLAHLI
ncbi:hypothetical protein LMH73_007320 [Vibrio splendidus]|nr:hypothetical protein [Vibrio splendidus]MCC4883137.1 hypothetical protein [Vibrio splendidus]